MWGGEVRWSEMRGSEVWWGEGNSHLILTSLPHTSSHFCTPHHTPHLTSLPLTSPYPHLTSPHLTSPHLISPPHTSHLTSLPLTSPHPHLPTPTSPGAHTSPVSRILYCVPHLNYYAWDFGLKMTRNIWRVSFCKWMCLILIKIPILIIRRIESAN